jgi:hypothetical protein
MIEDNSLSYDEPYRLVDPRIGGDARCGDKKVDPESSSG